MIQKGGWLLIYRGYMLYQEAIEDSESQEGEPTAEDLEQVDLLREVGCEVYLQKMAWNSVYLNFGFHCY